MSNSRKILTIAGLSVLGSIVYECKAQTKTSRPNIVFIMSDDHAYQAISAYGDRFAKVAPTPNIDRIAQNGMRFDRCLVTNSMAGQKKTLNRLPTREEYVILASKSF